MIRLIVLSQAFRQAGEATPRAHQVDPLNKLLHHYPLRRLEGESLRDSILLMSGKLRDSMFGPSIHPHRAEAKDYRRLFSGPLDGAGRRSIYLKVTRMEGMKFLETFDYPNPLVTRGRRDETNVPAQALTLLKRSVRNQRGPDLWLKGSWHSRPGLSRSASIICSARRWAAAQVLRNWSASADSLPSWRLASGSTGGIAFEPEGVERSASRGSESQGVSLYAIDW